MIDSIQKELSEAKGVLDTFMSSEKNLKNIASAAEVLIQTFKSQGAVYSCGNGGSMCDAMHFAEELSGRFRDDRKPLPAVAISDPGYLSCVSNDYGYEDVFSRYVEAFGKKGDALLAISTSGNSKNVINAAIKAKEKGMSVVALTGKDGGQLKDVSDIEIRVEHNGYADRIQEVHIKVIHTLILLIEKGLK